MPHRFRHTSTVAVLIGLAGWLIPGTGHLLLRLWSRGLAVFVAVAALAWTGVAVRGRLFTMATDDFFDLLGFAADCGAGLFFYLAQKWTNGGANVAHAAGDYGTRFFAAAGVLNVLAAVDAYRIARGQEHADADHDDRHPAPALDATPAANAHAGGADHPSELRLEQDDAGQPRPAQSSAEQSQPAPPSAPQDHAAAPRDPSSAREPEPQ